jgi:hypothetical protein
LLKNENPWHYGVWRQLRLPKNPPYIWIFLTRSFLWWFSKSSLWLSQVHSQSHLIWFFFVQLLLRLQYSTVNYYIPNSGVEFRVWLDTQHFEMHFAYHIDSSNHRSYKQASRILHVQNQKYTRDTTAKITSLTPGLREKIAFLFYVSFVNQRKIEDLDFRTWNSNRMDMKIKSLYISIGNAYKDLKNKSPYISIEKSYIDLKVKSHGPGNQITLYWDPGKRQFLVKYKVLNFHPAFRGHRKYNLWVSQKPELPTRDREYLTLHQWTRLKHGFTNFKHILVTYNY